MALTISQALASSYPHVIAKRPANQWSESAVLRALEKLGAITATAGALQNVGELSVQAAGAVDLTNAANSIAVLGQVNVTGAGNSLKLLNSVDLAVNGPVAVAQDVSLTTTGATKIAVGGDLAANGTLTLAAGTGGIALVGGSALSGERPRSCFIIFCTSMTPPEPAAFS